MDRLSIKDPTTYAEQREILADKGCAITDAEFCESTLAKLGYYRLSAYFLPFKTKDGSYRGDVSFERILKIYEFDRKLRNILFSAIEVAEVNLRARLSYHHSHKYGPLGYLSEDNFNQRHGHSGFLDRLNATIRSNGSILFVRHHNSKYGGQFPFWVIVELFTFGQLSYFYADLKAADQRAISQPMVKSTPQDMASWLRCCTDLRNICAHYGRLYYRVFPAIPASFPQELKKSERRLFSAIWALKHLHPDADVWRRDVIYPLSMLIAEYEADIDLEHIGFPLEWETALIKEG
ncbi:MAG: Abi family protein [Clostridiales bacterium]|nr:Abi family protein [Clostridiales bacterium]